MAKCGFCGHESHEGARVCVACGNVLAGASDSRSDTRPAAESEARDELAALGPQADPPPRPAPSTPSPDATAGEPSLAGLFEPGPLRRTARQALGMAAVGVALAAASAVAIVLDAGDVRDALNPDVFTLDTPEMAGRSDLLTLAELSVVAGVLVMLAGWAQQVAANRALLGGGAPGSPDRSSRQVLAAVVVPGVNAVTAPQVVTQLWRDATPPGASRQVPGVVRTWAVLFGVAVVARVLGFAWTLVAWPEFREAADVDTAVLVLVGVRVLWIAALVATALVVRRLTARQEAQAEALVSG